MSTWDEGASAGSGNDYGVERIHELLERLGDRKSSHGEREKCTKLRLFEGTGRGRNEFDKGGRKGGVQLQGMSVNVVGRTKIFLSPHLPSARRDVPSSTVSLILTPHLRTLPA